MSFSENTQEAINESLMRVSTDLDAHHSATIAALEKAVFGHTVMPIVVAVQCPECGETLQVVNIIHFYPQTFQAKQEENVERDIFIGKRAAIFTIKQLLWVIITFGIAYVFYWLKSFSTTYRITTQRIVIEKGVLFKTKNIIELIRVNDFGLERPWTMRFLGYGILHITFSVPELSSVYLYGIKDIDNLYEQLHKAVIAGQRKRQVDWLREAYAW